MVEAHLLSLRPSQDFPGTTHADVWFLVDATPPDAHTVAVPPWFAKLAWHDPERTPASAYARAHEDVVARWLTPRPS